MIYKQGGDGNQEADTTVYNITLKDAKALQHSLNRIGIGLIYDYKQEVSKAEIETVQETAKWLQSEASKFVSYIEQQKS